MEAWRPSALAALEMNSTGTAAKAGGVSALAVDDGFAVRTVDEIGVTFGESCLGKASAGP